MQQHLKIFAVILLITLHSACKAVTPGVADLQADTWVATDALGRQMPTAEANPLKTDKDRYVGIFYITWHGDRHFTEHPAPYGGDVTRTLNANPDARLQAYNSAWTDWSLHWGEPEDGYFLSTDRYVMRKDMSALADAGVDVLILDCTNGERYWQEWDILFDVMTQMKTEGNPVPKICFWCFNDDPVNCVTEIYNRYYKPGRYADLWFYWDGKPLMCYNDNPDVDANGSDLNRGFYPDEVIDFFTLRNLWWGFYNWGGKPNFERNDSWCFGYELNDSRVAALTPGQRASTHNGVVEEMAVTTAQHSITTTGKSWCIGSGEPSLDIYDMPDSAYVPWLGKTVANPEGYGIYFQDRWDEALQVDPPFIYVNDWNEWTAGKFLNPEVRQNGDTIYRTFLGRENPFFFVDQYNAEFNRTIQPMKGGYTDNYYYQLVQNIRRYKGVRPIPEATRPFAVNTVADWDDVVPVFYDTRGDVAHRDHNGYGGLHYTNTSGRNDIVKSKVAVDGDFINFYAECDADLTPYTDYNWMLLLIDADSDSSTGWGGYDYLVNKNIKSEDITTLCRYDAGRAEWMEVADVPYHVTGDCLTVRLPLYMLGGLNSDCGSIDFKWADNPQTLSDVIELCINGDTAPNRRFNYRFKWNFTSNNHQKNL